VFETEPMLADHPLKCHDQVILSPHIAGLTEGAAELMATGSAQNILDCFEERIYPQLIVNRERPARVET
jgi:D-3-phosphoglycerate dehydrogenase / 2-oxoglutarate reductase